MPSPSKSPWVTLSELMAMGTDPRILVILVAGRQERLFLWGRSMVGSLASTMPALCHDNVLGLLTSRPYRRRFGLFQSTPPLVGAVLNG